MKFDVIVIGAGAAGMLCAGKLSSNGLRTLLIEKKPKAGSKLRITGKGRCNITNDSNMKEHLSHLYPKANFLRNAYSSFFVEDIIKLLNQYGVETKVERGNRVFPVSDKAQDVVDAFEKFCFENGTKFNFNDSVISVNKLGSEFKVKTKAGQEYQAVNVIIATGGKSYPVTGSTGDGFTIAKTLGHTIINPLPALVPFETQGNLAQQMQGVSLKNVSASIWHDNKKLHEEFGEMMFTHFGVTGPIILTLSNLVCRSNFENVGLHIDLKPAISHKELDQRILKDIDLHGNQSFESLLKGYLPRKMISVCADSIKVSLDKKVNQISSTDRKNLRAWLKDLRLIIKGTRSFKEAIITSGGVSLDDINKKTMESKIVANLYFIGEVIDLHADTGGFNLQIAYSTAYLAAKSIIKSML